MSLRLSSINTDKSVIEKLTLSEEKGLLHCSTEVGHSWVNFRDAWESLKCKESGSVTKTLRADVISLDSCREFDTQGELIDESDDGLQSVSSPS